MFISDKRLYLTEDRKQVVEGEDANGNPNPAARFLLVAEGGELPDAEARKYGLGESATAPTPVEKMQKALESAEERGAFEEAEIHRRNLERLKAEEAHAEKERKSISGPVATKQVKGPAEDK